jgi:hypothetical protein
MSPLMSIAILAVSFALALSISVVMSSRTEP